ncbi:MAG: precorrin-2 C(20)-methyltransferase [Oscillospiraceae bacterium]|nr:precorrin-2 C(20)-methyltransferase [Oscillospiraceae bacterium]
MSGRGIAYGVGVGPGDPDLITLKAVKLIRENDVIAVPDREPKESIAYRIAESAVPELAEKEIVPVHMPMVRDKDELESAHREGASLLEKYLDQGRNVVYIALGDITVYCTFSYLQDILEEDGYTVELVPGVPSFCAAAARLGLSLAEGDGSFHVAPASCTTAEDLNMPGTFVLMKAASHMPEVKEMLQRSGREVSAVENCGMAEEKIYRKAEEIPDDSGYFSLIIAGERLDTD